jgi:hypothetical protein
LENNDLEGVMRICDRLFLELVCSVRR